MHLRRVHARRRDVDIRISRSSFTSRVISRLNQEDDDACDGAREGDRGQ
jgi:hypothetical protein